MPDRGFDIPGGNLPSKEEIKKYRLQLLVIIVDRGQVKNVTEALSEEHVHFQYAFLGHGTASSEILDLLGLGAMEKSIVLCVTPRFRITAIIKTLGEKLNLSKPGHGIAFTVPLSGVNTPVMMAIDAECRDQFQNLFDEKVEIVSVNTHFDLIVSVVNQGNSEDLMESAKEAGAQGGTVINARRIGAEEAAKFFGISIHPEKEIIAILTRRETKPEIMKAICQNFGMNTEARGFVFSLPVEQVEGLAL